MLVVGGHDGPDKYSFSFFIAVCSCLDQSDNFHSMVVKKRLEHDAIVKNSLVSMHIAFGVMDDAKELFDEMTGLRYMVLWTAIVVGA
ncbi:unnamed protein product [Victoria cruziana]